MYPAYNTELEFAMEKIKVKLLDTKDLVFYCKSNKYNNWQI